MVESYRPRDFLHGSRVLVIDADEGFYDLINHVFTSEGYLAENAVTGRRGIERAAGESFELFIIDENIGDVPGEEIVIRLRTLRPAAEFILTTATASYDSAVTALRLGVFDYLEKPFADIGYLTEKVHRALEKQRLGHENHMLRQHVNAVNADLKLLRKAVEQSIGDKDKVHIYLTEMVDRLTAEYREENWVMSRALGKVSKFVDLLETALTASNGVPEATTPQKDGIKRLLGQIRVAVAAARIGEERQQ